MTWLGSISMDGNPGGVGDDEHGAATLRARTPADYGRALAEFLTASRDATWAVEPWPWPWSTSRTTDYAYAFDPATGKVHATHDDYWYVVDLDAPLCGEPAGLEGHAAECEISGAVDITAHTGCEGYPFDAQRDEADRVNHPDMSDRRGSWEHVMGRSGRFVITPTGLADTKTEPAPSTAELGAAYILAATGAVTELAGLPPGPGESGFDLDALTAAIRVREVQRAAGLRGEDPPALSHHLAQMIEAESSPAGRPSFADEVDAAVGKFLSDTVPEAPDPETEAAMREGFEANAPAQMYAVGYAAGEAAGMVKATLEGTADALVEALTDLQHWATELRGELHGQTPRAALSMVIDEIDRRILAAKGEPIPVTDAELPNRKETS